VLRSGLTALGRDRRLLAVACVAALVTGVLETAMLYLMGTVAVAMTNGTNRAEVSPGPLGSVELSIGAAVALAGAALAVLVAVSVPAARLLGLLSSRASVRLRTRLVRNYLQTSAEYRATHREGHVEQLVGEYGQLADLAVVQVVTLIVSLCTLSILLIAAVLASPLAALGAVAVLTLSTLALRPLTLRTTRFSQRSQAVNAEVVSQVGQTTRLADEISAFAVGGAVAEDLERDIRRSGAFLRRIRAEQRLIPGLYQYSGLGPVLILIGLLVELEPDGLPALAPLILLLIRALMYMRQTIIASRMAAELVPYIDALDAELVRMRANRAPQDGVALGRFAGIELRGVGYAYPDGPPVLAGVDLTIGPGEMLGVVGASGSGKSSFLRAGLIPRLQRDDRRFLVLGIMRPERHPLTGEDGFAAAIHGARRDLGLTRPSLGAIKKACLGDADQVCELLVELRDTAAARLIEMADGTDTVGHAATQADDESSAPTLVLPLDQAEELFAAEAGQQADQFLALVADLIGRLNATETGLIVAATIRTDRYEAMQNHQALADIDTVLFDELKPMPREEFKDVITGPAARATEGGVRLEVDPKLVTRLLGDAGEGADTLPLLALTLNRLYHDYADTGQLTLADYEAMGGMRDVVDNEIEQILDDSPHDRADALEMLRAAFIPWLATINPDNNEAMRRVARQSELPDTGGLIDAMIDKRLLVRDQRDGEVVVEVALESLLRQWDDLDGWLREERQNLKTVDDIERSATAWELHDHDPAWLLPGTRLVDAENLAATPGFKKRLAGAHAYLAACREAEDQRLAAEEERREAEVRHAQERQQVAEAHNATLRKQSRVLRAVLAATAIAAVVAVVGGVIAAVARSEAQNRFREATGLRLAAEAQSMLARTRAGGDPRAFQELVTASVLAPDASYGALYAALSKKADTLKVIESPSNSVAFTPDGDRIATAGPDGTVRLWNADTGAPVGEPLTGHTDWVTSVAFGGDRLASGSRDHTVRLWNAADGSPVGQPLTGHADAVTAVAVSADGRLLASGSADDTVRLWDATTGAPVGGPLTGQTDWVTSVAFTPDGRRVAAGGRDGTVRVYSTETGAPIGQPLAGHTGAVTSLAFAGDRLASGGADRTIRLWNVDTMTPIGSPLTGHTDEVTGVAFSPDGHVLVSASADHTARRWNADTGTPLGQPMSDHTDKVTGIAFSPDGQRIATTSQDDTVRLWKADAGVALGQPLSGHTGAVTSVAFGPDTVATGSEDGTVRLWDPHTGAPIGKPMRSGADTVTSVAFSPDGHRLASASHGGTVQVWNADTGTPIGRPLTGHSGDVTSVVFGGGDRLATGGADGTARLWNADTGTPIGRPLTGHTDWVTGVALSPDGKRLATASADGTARLWDTETGTQVGDPLTGHTDWVTSVAFSPDGTRLATGGRDDVVRLWDAQSGAAIGKPLAGHSNWVTSVAFSPDGRRLATASADNTVRLWNADTGDPLGDAIAGHTDWVNAVAFSPDGDLLATGGNDDSVRVWLAVARPEALCDKLTYNMSQKQWNDWVSPDIDYIAACTGLPQAPD